MLSEVSEAGPPSSESLKIAFSILLQSDSIKGPNAKKQSLLRMKQALLCLIIAKAAALPEHLHVRKHFGAVEGVVAG